MGNNGEAPSRLHMTPESTILSSDPDSLPLLPEENTLKYRMRARWYQMDRVSRLMTSLVVLILGGALIMRVFIELSNPLDYWPSLRRPNPPKHHEGTVTAHTDEQRRAAVRDAMRHAWSGYHTYAFGHDELQPVSNKPNDKWGGWGVTLIDALDTLYIMELYEEFNQGVAHAVNVDFSKAVPGYKTPFFEMIIRSLAGLLTAYEMSLDKRLLTKAQQVGDVLMPAFNTSTGIPYPRVDVNAGVAVSATSVCLAEAGTVQLEYWKLSELTGNPVYHNTAQRVVDILDKAKKPYKGLYPIWIDIDSGTLTSGQITFGAQGDSWYEYMLKQYIFSRRSHDQYRRMYEESIDSMKEKMVRRSEFDEQMYYIGDLDASATKISPKFQHLTCFVPGMLALGSKTLDRPDDLELAKKLTYTCFQMYNQTTTGLGPEYVLFRDGNNKGLLPTNLNSDFDIQDLPIADSNEKEIGFYLGSNRSYILRPETVESIMILYRITGDAMYKEWGWQIFQAIDKWTKTPAGFSAYKDVMATNSPSQLTDSMESFFLAETLKYLYLLFSPIDYYSLDEYVFNTEAHPFKI
ncbi:hypothetical protein GGI04_003967 [Coemansia thaxteri]|uniref:alpha-1,2-Mannosidase n=1 Tax=Coemansia thaxteri TaxID=2663907 RepID=A0A9W8ELR7_9FUNG|nr:hypothetical protein GGI04_003967 [Coemansia thaxteri]KAJ2008612.1 hypothetical protein H4R26_000091 [Coemansia thaxteri]KAJ2488140.1 hypothetical protein EV174_000102 [Coemansia sp. RSA 2320]